MVKNKHIIWFFHNLKGFAENHKSFIISFCIGITILQSIRICIHPVIVYGHSMEPTYINGQIVSNRRDFAEDELVRGTVVVLYRTDTVFRKQLIKRVVGIPGDTLYIKNGLLYINDSLYDEYQFETIINAGVLSSPLVIGQHEYFCMGDNRNHSNDSRTFGAIPYENILALVTE